MMKGLLFALSFLLISVESFGMQASDSPPADYCSDQASWQQWEKLLADHPQDDSVASLYAFRLGLCSMIRSGRIETERAIKLFEGMRDAAINGKLEDEGTNHKKIPLMDHLGSTGEGAMAL